MMFLPSVRFVGAYRFPQKMRQVFTFHSIGITLAGVIHSRIYFPDGKFAGEMPPGQVFLSLGIPGLVSDFEFGPDRENHVIFLENAPFGYDPSIPSLVLADGDAKIPFPNRVAIPEEEVPFYKNLVANITIASNSSQREDRLKANLLAGSLLARFLGHKLLRRNDPVAEFKRLLDADLVWEHSLDEWSNRAGLGRDRIRTLFQKRYHVTPSEYRSRARLDRLLNLILHTDIPFKSLAFDCGLRNVSHLNILMKKHFSKTPGELRRSGRNEGNK